MCFDCHTQLSNLGLICSDALLTVLEYCGDINVQYGIVEILMLKEDVVDYKKWFAEVWFKSMPKTMLSFLQFMNAHPHAEVSFRE